MSVADLSAHKAIHRVGSRFNKADYYHYFGANDAGRPPYNLFQMTNPLEHAARRKLLGRGFTTTSLRADYEDMIYSKVVVAIDGMIQEAKAASGEVEILKWWRLMSSDVVSQLMFGECFNQLKSGEVK